MSRTVHYDTNGNEIYEEDFDTTTYPQEQLEYLKEKEELMKMEKEKQMVTKYKQALSYAARDFARTKTNCSKCECRDSCGCDPNTVGCRLTLYLKWERDAGIKDNHGADGTLAYAQEQLADVERRETVDHPDYYKRGGIEAIDVIEAWDLGFCLGNTVKYISRAGRKSDKILEDLEKAAWYLNREINSLKSKRR